MNLTEKEVENIAIKVLDKTKEKFISLIENEYYNGMKDYLYEHYENHRDELELKLINQITEDFVNDINNSKYFNLRKKIFNENKDEIIKKLSDEAIEKSVEDVIEKYTHRDYHFEWRWNDAISDIIFNNISKFSKNDRVLKNIERKYENKISFLTSKIVELKEDVVNCSTCFWGGKNDELAPCKECTALYDLWQRK